MSEQNYRLGVAEFSGYSTVIVNAGRCRTERIVPPAGEDYAFDRDVWDHRVEVCVSPTGRSVRVWIDGQEVKP